MPKPPEKRLWTVLVYMVAEDAGTGPLLDPIADQELRRIIGSADPKRMHVAVQVDYRNKPGVRRQIVGRDPQLRRESLAGDPDVLTEFLDFGLTPCPADHYLVFFWGHSFGTAGLFPDERPRTTRFENTLSLPELGYVLGHAADKVGKPIDILLFKNCCISTLETAYELQGSAKYMIASQGRVPSHGYPYERILKSLDRMPVDETAAAILDQLGDFYGDSANRETFSEVPYSLIDIDGARQVKTPLKLLVEDLIAARKEVDRGTQTRRAMLRASHPNPGDAALLDVAMLCDELQKLRARGVGSAAGAVEAAVEMMVVDRQPSTSPFFKGLSLFYFPSDPIIRAGSIVAPVTFAKDYRRLKLSADTQWDLIALETMPDSESLFAVQIEKENHMPEKEFGLGVVRDAVSQTMIDLAGLDHLVRRLAAALTRVNEPGIKSIVDDIFSTVGNIKSNVESLDAEIGQQQSANRRYKVGAAARGFQPPGHAEVGAVTDLSARLMGIRSEVDNLLARLQAAGV